MRIGVVAYEMEGQRTGVGRYLEGLLRGAAELGSPHEWVLFFKGEPFDLGLEGPFEARFDRRPGAHPILWEQLRLPRLVRRAGVEAVFSPAYSLPEATGVPGIVALHDLSFEHLGGEFGFKERWRRRLLARRAARRAARIVTGTRRIAREIAHTYRVPEAKIGVVPLGVERPAEPAPEARAELERLSGGAPYLLFLGSILPRRRLDLAIDAFSELAAERPELRLIIAGSNRLPQPEELERWIARSPAAERISHLGYVPEPLVPALLAGASALLYFSTYEGYGMPPLEALAAGTPAITCGDLALDELWSGYPYKSRKLDATEIAAVGRRLLGDADERRHIAREGRERMARESWRRGAEIWLEVIERGLHG